MRILAPANSFDRVSQSNYYHEKSSVTKKIVKALATATALYITFKAIECLAAEGVDSFKNRAYGTVKQALDDLLAENYAVSWIRVIPARAYFCAGAALKAVKLPFNVGRVCVRFVENV
jgi:hypothetical protein